MRAGAPPRGGDAMGLRSQAQLVLGSSGPLKPVLLKTIPPGRAEFLKTIPPLPPRDGAAIDVPSMAYREVTMVEIKEVLRLWRAGTKKKRIAAELTLDVKTVRRYIGAAESCGLAPGPEPLSDEQVASVVVALSPDTGRPHGDGWQLCETERADNRAVLLQRVRLSKVRRLLHRRGVDVPYATLHRFAVAELGFGQRAPTIPVADGKPGRGGSHRHGLDDADRARRAGPPMEVPRVDSSHRMSRATSS